MNQVSKCIILHTEVFFSKGVYDQSSYSQLPPPRTPQLTFAYTADRYSRDLGAALKALWGLLSGLS